MRHSFPLIIIDTENLYFIHGLKQWTSGNSREPRTTVIIYWYVLFVDSESLWFPKFVSSIKSR